VSARRACGTLTPAPAPRDDDIGGVDEDDLAGLGSLARAGAEVGPLLVAARDPDRQPARDRPQVEDRHRESGADRDEVREVHQCADRRQLALLGQSAQERLGRRPVLGRIHAERSEHASPRGQRRDLAQGPITDPRPDRGLLGGERLGQAGRRRAVRDTGRVDDATDHRREALADRGVVPERGHHRSIRHLHAVALLITLGRRGRDASPCGAVCVNTLEIRANARLPWRG
jgi:hypothetical protein